MRDSEEYLRSLVLENSLLRKEIERYHAQDHIEVRRRFKGISDSALLQTKKHELVVLVNSLCSRICELEDRLEHLQSKLNTLKLRENEVEFKKVCMKCKKKTFETIDRRNGPARSNSRYISPLLSCTETAKSPSVKNLKVSRININRPCSAVPLEANGADYELVMHGHQNDISNRRSVSLEFNSNIFKPRSYGSNVSDSIHKFCIESDILNVCSQSRSTSPSASESTHSRLRTDVKSRVLGKGVFQYFLNDVGDCSSRMPPPLSVSLQTEKPDFLRRSFERQLLIKEASIFRTKFAAERRVLAKHLLARDANAADIASVLQLRTRTATGFSHSSMARETLRRLEQTKAYREQRFRRNRKADMFVNRLMAHCFSEVVRIGRFSGSHRS